MQTPHKRVLNTIFSIQGLIMIDQASKWYVTQYLFPANQTGYAQDAIDWMINPPAQLNDFALMPVTSFFNLVMVWNYGISFGMFNDGDSSNAMILSMLSLTLTGFFLVWLLKTTDALQRAGLILVIGGALGNVIDRFRFGAVIDFLDVHVAGYHWPAFNLADSFICVGVVLLLIHTIWFDKDENPDKRKL